MLVDVNFFKGLSEKVRNFRTKRALAKLTREIDAQIERQRRRHGPVRDLLVTKQKMVFDFLQADVSAGRGGQ